LLLYVNADFKIAYCIYFLFVSIDVHPSIRMAPSEQAKKNEFPHNLHTVSIYCHWLALELSKVWDYLKWKFQVNSSNDSIKVQNNKDFTIDQMVLNEAFRCIEIACNEADEVDAKGFNFESFSNHEVAMTSYVAQIFDCFLFPDHIRSGFCLHQAPLGGDSSAPYQPD